MAEHIPTRIVVIQDSKVLVALETTQQGIGIVELKKLRGTQAIVIGRDFEREGWSIDNAIVPENGVYFYRPR